MFRFHIFTAAVILTCPIARGSPPFLYPKALQTETVVRTFLADDTKPDMVLSELAGAKLIQAEPLLFRARVDDRPLVVDQFLLSAHVKIGGISEWWLMLFVRNPYGPYLSDGTWQLSFQRGGHSPYALKRLKARPKNADVTEFLNWIQWDDGVEYQGFKDIYYLCFTSIWKSVTGVKPPELKGSLTWPPSD